MTRPATAADPLLEWRKEFPTVEATLHFISHSLGAMPRGVEEALRLYAMTWKTRGIRAWDEGWFVLPAEVGDLIGGLIGAPSGSVSLHPNVTLAQAIALSTIDFTPPRNRLVCTAEDFPSVLYLYEGLARRGAEIVRVPAREGRRIDEADLVRAINERTAVVALSHVLFRTSQIVDLAPIVRRAREVGAVTLIDAYQTVGCVPIDVSAAGIDYLTGGSVKWLCAGPGTGYLFANPKRAAAAKPAITGWMGHARPFDFDSGPMRWDEGPRHFANGTPAIPAIAAARPGIETVARIGVEAIRAKSLRQTERLIGWADELGLTLVSPREPERRGGTVVIDLPEAGRVAAALLDEDVLLDHRPGVGIRLGPHFYTKDEEVDVVMKRVHAQMRKTTG